MTTIATFMAARPVQAFHRICLIERYSASVALEKFLAFHDIDFTREDNFHDAMRLMLALGLPVRAFAEAHGYQPAIVERWGSDASRIPPRLRREPIVKDACEFLLANPPKHRRRPVARWAPVIVPMPPAKDLT